MSDDARWAIEQYDTAPSGPECPVPGCGRPPRHEGWHVSYGKEAWPWAEDDEGWYERDRRALNRSLERPRRRRGVFARSYETIRRAVG
jgi:hypothetical protein